MVLADQIQLPTLNYIHRRPRLLNRLSDFVEAHQRLISIYAPGGYGKSILLADFAQTTDLPVCWCSLVPANRDPTSFLTILTYSITDRFHEIDPAYLHQIVAQGETQTSIRHIVEALVNVGEHIIIIDDYHKAVSASVNLVLDQLLEQLPTSSTIIVAARGDMNLDTSQIIDLLMTERMSGLSEDDLQFTAAEIQRVMRKRFGRQFALADAEAIAQATDGNIAQVLLTGHMQDSYAGQMIVNLRERLGEDRVVIYDYLATEVFDKQPPDLQKFMLHTAILPDMTVDLCNALLGVQNAQASLERLVRKDLFITQVGGGFRYHDLFGEFLRARVADNPSEYHSVTLRVATILVENNRIEDAMNRYLMIDSFAEAAALLEIYWRTFYDTGRAMTLDHWLAQISAAVLGQHPELLMLQARILSSDQGQLAQAMTVYQQAEAQFNKEADYIGKAKAQLGQANILEMMGQAREGLIAAEKGLSQLAQLEASDEDMAYAIRIRGLAYGIVGDTPKALEDFRRSLELYEKIGDQPSVGTSHQDIGVCLEKQGSLNSASYHYQQALSIWETLGNAKELANALNSLGVCAQLRGYYDKALDYFDDSLKIATQNSATRRMAFAQAGIGDAYLGNQSYSEAFDAYEISIRYTKEAGVQSLQIYNLVKQAECLFEQNDLVQAMQLARRAKDIALENGLNYQQGLACGILGKLYVQRAEYKAGFAFFGQAEVCLAENDTAEQIKVYLWWAYGLWRNLRTADAFTYLQEAIKLSLTLGELLPSAKPTLVEVQDMLFHFLHQPDTLTSFRHNLHALLSQIDIWPMVRKPQLQIFSFSSPWLIVGDQLKQFNQRGGSSQVAEFLLYLAFSTRRGGCRWDELSAVLWPDETPERASIRFHQYLKRLRNRLFGRADYIQVHNDHYQLNRDALAWCDALVFEDLYERISATSTEEALDLQLALINLYKGEFLAGQEISEWAEMHRAQCENRFLQTVKLASGVLLKRGAYQAAIQVLDKGLAQDFYREDLHRDILQACAQLGLYGDLTGRYKHLCQVFEAEFDLPPDPATVQVYEDLIATR